jgi:uncharacterized SAM-binding protein YcdF (DUF218 family)
MYNLASKILGPLFDPLTLAIVLAACALLAWKRRRLAFRLLVAAIALLLVFTSRVTVGALVGSLENQYRDSGLDVPPAQAIVVLGGTIQMPSAIHHLTGLVDPSDRLLVAFRLYRSGKAPLVFCSGGNNPIGGQTGKAPGALWMARLLEEWNIPSTGVQIEGGSIDTHENAIRSYQVLAPLGIRRILLVTSAMHMPRAAGAFRKAGFEVIAAPADFRTGWDEPNVLLRWLPSADNLRNSDAALQEWLGIAMYRLRGWI